MLAIKRLHAMTLLSFLVLQVCAGCQTSPPPPVSGPIAITHVTLIAGTESSPQRDMTVVLADGRIAELGPTVKVAIPAGTRTFDASGKFLIPGLWDMHVHTLSKGLPEAFFPLFVANGITGVRDMGGDIPLPQVQHLKGEIASGTLLGPHIAAAGPIVDGPSPFWPFSISVSSPAEARDAVDSLARQKADFIKVYDSIPRETYFALAKEANRIAMPFAGHLPREVSTAEASDMGQRSLEHLAGVSLDVCSSAEILRQQTAEANAEEDATKARDAFFRINSAILICDTRAQTRLFDTLIKNHTWQVPTLVVLRSYAQIHDPALAADERLKYIPKNVRGFWSGMGGSPDARNDQIQHQLFLRSVRIVGDLHKAGVPLLAGTDTPNPYTYPGFSLHEELELFVQAGLSPLAALQSATRDAAAYLGESKDYGTIERGKHADMVLLEANPLDDIANTRRISAVFLNGKLLLKGDLEELLSDAASKAAK